MVDFAYHGDVLVRDLVVQSTAVFALGLLAARCVRVPARAHAVLLLAFLGAVTTPLASGVVRYAGWGILEPPAAASHQATRLPREKSQFGARPQVEQKAESTGASNVSVEVRPLPVPYRAIAPGAVLALLWLTGSVIAVGRLLRGVLAGTRLMAAAEPCQLASIETALRLARQRLGLEALAIHVFRSPVVRCPLLWCWGRTPRLILPCSAIERWSTAAWTPILCHELAHWNRRDHWTALAAELVCCLLPWQPLAWWAKRRLEQASEQACDDWAVAAGHSATDYVETLLGLVAQSGSPLQLAALRRKSDLGGRVRHLLSQRVPRPQAGRLWAFLALLVTATITGTAAFCQPGGARTEPVDSGKPITSFNDPAFRQWIKEVAALPAEKQVEAVARKLHELNPGFDGKVISGFENGVVTGLSLITDNVADISPIQAFVGLRRLDCYGGGGLGAGKLSDLSPLQGAALTMFGCSFTRVSDLSSLRGMPLTKLMCDFTYVSDLSPLKGMKLAYLSCSQTQVSDLSPLQGMPLRELYCGGSKISDLSPLGGMPISYLHCDGTPVSDLSPLEQCTSLKYLNVSHTQVALAGVVALQKSLPGCKIEWDNPAWPAQMQARPVDLDTRIYVALDEPTEVECRGVPLTDLREYFETRHQVTIKLDEAALKQANVDIESPVSGNIVNTPLKDALHTLLAPLKLTFIVKDHGLLITTEAEAKKR